MLLVSSPTRWGMRPRLGRRARLAALRATTDLHVPGNQAGRLLTEAVDALGDVAYWGRETSEGLQSLARAGRALAALTRAAGAIGETDEEQRCGDFLRDSSPEAYDALM